MARLLPEETRDLLLDRAEHRFWTFGFKKTTVDEVVADVGISKGSFYQFFESKDDLMLATIARWYQRIFQEQQSLIKNSQLPPAEKLRHILSAPILRTYRQYEAHPEVQDMIIMAHNALPTTLHALIQQQLALVANVLEEGRKSGHFAFADAAHTAQALHHMTHGFWPPYACVQGAQAIEQALNDVLDLVFQGLAAPTR